MISKTLYFGNPCYLRTENNQLMVVFPDSMNKKSSTIPIEDVGLIVLDHPQITLTQSLLAAFMERNVAVLSCDSRHLPAGLFLPMSSNHTYTEKLRRQLSASEPLRKNLWQQTIKAKITNQASVLRYLGEEGDKMIYWASKVRSGDPDNYEGRAAAYYWKLLFGREGFRRHRYGDTPNNLLNYGYAVLRAIVARALVASGMLPAVGIHHRNKYNSYCLADDIMEPYRPFIDLVVLDVLSKHDDQLVELLAPEVKRDLLIIPTIDVSFEEGVSPLMVGVQRTTASLMQCFEGERRKVNYPYVSAKN